MHASVQASKVLVDDWYATNTTSAPWITARSNSPRQQVEEGAEVQWGTPRCHSHSASKVPAATVIERAAAEAHFLVAGGLAAGSVAAAGYTVEQGIADRALGIAAEVELEYVFPG